MLGTALYRLLGGAPAPLVKRAFQLTSIDKYVTRPLAVAANLHDREWLAQVEAVDAFMDQMHAYPGRTMGQLYHQFFRVNELAGGTLQLGDRTIDLAEVRVPVLSVAGEADVLAPRAAVHAIERLLPNAPQVRLERAPGGHLGCSRGAAPRARPGPTWTTSSRSTPRGPSGRRCASRPDGKTACSTAPPARAAATRGYLRGMRARLLLLLPVLAVVVAGPATAAAPRPPRASRPGSRRAAST
jgi:polyhydroxyalkanoate synthase